MKQLIQNMRNGKTTVTDIPAPQVRSKMALVRTAASLVSVGTERMVVEFAEKNLLGKAKSRPDLVKQTIEKARREGLVNTVEAAFNRLDQPMALGYSSAGIIEMVGEGLEGFQVGDRVACAGGNYAVHAEFELVPQNLLVHLPDKVSFEDAAFATLGAIAMQGFRLASPQIGDKVAVVGLGLLGLLSVEIAAAAGCQVFGVDVNEDKVKLAGSLGIQAVIREGAESSAQVFTNGRGFDCVLICADTKSDDPVQFSGTIAREHGVVVAVGAVGLNLPRKIYYDKELDFRVSRSYGPGRYDPTYEEKGVDYPYGYVRWTEGRNIEAYVDLLAGEKVNPSSFVTHRFPIENAGQAYDLITGKVQESFLGILITYGNQSKGKPETKIKINDFPPSKSNSENGKSLSVGVLGAGNYAGAVFLPAIKKTGGVIPQVIVSASGVSSHQAARKYGFHFASSSENDVLSNPDIDVAVILTRHQHHARQVLTALQAGKAVYCEKPLALNFQELDGIKKALQAPETPLMMVGFNRRFAPLSVELKRFLEPRSEPMVAHYRVNAGFLPLNHWTQDPAIGGGRIIGEGCHFIDYLTFLVGEAPVSVVAQKMPDHGKYKNDNVVLTFTYPDGSLGTVTYLSNGDKSLPKEYLEVFCGGKVAILKDFRFLQMVYQGKTNPKNLFFGQDKGHQKAWKTFLDAILQGNPPPIPYQHLLGVTAASFKAVESLASAEKMSIDF